MLERVQFSTREFRLLWLFRRPTGFLRIGPGYNHQNKPQDEDQFLHVVVLPLLPVVREKVSGWDKDKVLM
jgi:hypothetical protein